MSVFQVNFYFENKIAAFGVLGKVELHGQVLEVEHSVSKRQR